MDIAPRRVHGTGRHKRGVDKITRDSDSYRA